MRNKTKKYRRLKPPLLNVARTMGKWLPSDDFLLIQSVTQLNDLESVLQLTQFSSKFSLKDIKQRWFAILYDSKISRMIYSKIKTIHTDDVIRLKKLAPFSDIENQLLLSLDSTIDNNKNNNKEIEFFENFLLENRISFHEARTPQSLEQQWKQLKELCLLKDQAEQLEQNNKSIEVPFSLVEARLSDDLILDRVDLTETNEPEMKENYDKLVKEIKRAEADVFLWQVLADKVTGRTNPFLSADTIAVLFSEQTEFVMKSREVTLGRSSTHTQVDFDLSTLTSNKKISRLQCKICLVEDDVFFLSNRGSLTVWIDGEPVEQEKQMKLNDKALIQIDSVSILFLINYNNIAPKSVN